LRAGDSADRDDRSAVNIRPPRATKATISSRVHAPTRKAGYRSLVTVLTKRWAEDSTEYRRGKGIRVRYYAPAIIEHSERSSHPRFAARARSTRWSASIAARRSRHPRMSAGRRFWTQPRKVFCASETSRSRNIGRAARNVERAR